MKTNLETGGGKLEKNNVTQKPTERLSRRSFLSRSAVMSAMLTVGSGAIFPKSAEAKYVASDKGGRVEGDIGTYETFLLKHGAYLQETKKSNSGKPLEWRIDFSKVDGAVLNDVNKKREIFDAAAAKGLEILNSNNYENYHPDENGFGQNSIYAQYRKINKLILDDNLSGKGSQAKLDWYKKQNIKVGNKTLPITTLFNTPSTQIIDNFVSQQSGHSTRTESAKTYKRSVEVDLFKGQRVRDLKDVMLVAFGKFAGTEVIEHENGTPKDLDRMTIFGGADVPVIVQESEVGGKKGEKIIAFGECSGNPIDAYYVFCKDKSGKWARQQGEARK